MLKLFSVSGHLGCRRWDKIVRDHLTIIQVQLCSLQINSFWEKKLFWMVVKHWIDYYTATVAPLLQGHPFYHAWFQIHCDSKILLNVHPPKRGNLFYQSTFSLQNKWLSKSVTTIIISYYLLDTNQILQELLTLSEHLSSPWFLVGFVLLDL